MMSAKQTLRKIVNRLPESASWGDILSELLPYSTGAVPQIEYSMDEMTEEEWAIIVANGLDPELSADPDYDEALPVGSDSHDAR